MPKTTKAPNLSAPCWLPRRSPILYRKTSTLSLWLNSLLYSIPLHWLHFLCYTSTPTRLLAFRTSLNTLLHLDSANPLARPRPLVLRMPLTMPGKDYSPLHV